MVLEQFNTLVIAVEEDPYEILMAVFPFIHLSSSIVIYHPYREPLCQCYMKMKKNYGKFIDIILSDTWLREYQVSKNRTHPSNFMNGQSGYILRAKKIEVNA